MQRSLKIAGWCMGILILLVGIGIWRNFFFYPKIWSARTTVDGKECADCAIYIDRTRIGGVFVRRIGNNTEVFSVAFPSTKFDVPHGAIWKCEDGAFSFAPGLAMSNLYERCAPWGFPNAQKLVEMHARSLAFTADDGKRVSVEW